MLNSSQNISFKTQFMSVKGKQTQQLRSDNDDGIQSTEYLIINKDQNYHGFSENTSEITSELPSINLLELNQSILMAKQQGQKLKNQNLKLKIEKQNLSTKTTKNGTFKLVPLKIEHQNLKKQIQRLTHEKQMLLLNKQIKNNIKVQPHLQTNEVSLKTFEKTPAFLYQRKQVLAELNKKTQNNSLWHLYNAKITNSSSQSPTHASLSKAFAHQSLKSSNHPKFTFQATSYINNKSYDFSLSMGKPPKPSTSYSHRTFTTQSPINTSLNA